MDMFTNFQIPHCVENFLWTCSRIFRFHIAWRISYGHVHEFSDSTLRGEFLKDFGVDLFLKYGFSSLAAKIVMGLVRMMFESCCSQV